VSFTNRVVLITGAGSGMGRAMAHEFATAGARIAALDINAETAAATARSVGAGALAVQADVGAADDVSRALREVLNAFGRVDLLCNNAGILAGFADALNTSDELWQRVIATNLTGPSSCPVQCCRTCSSEALGSSSTPDRPRPLLPAVVAPHTRLPSTASSGSRSSSPTASAAGGARQHDLPRGNAHGHDSRPDGGRARRGADRRDHRPAIGRT
jgi:NAD(P)-dependent dehydrogenase (short-subunit alcohol dehydrogenase family)